MCFSQVLRSIRSFEYQPERGRFRGWLGVLTRNEIANAWNRINRVTQGQGKLVTLGLPEHQVVHWEDGVWEEELAADIHRVALERTRLLTSRSSVLGDLQAHLDRGLSGLPGGRAAGPSHRARLRGQEPVPQVVPRRGRAPGRGRHGTGASGIGVNSRSCRIESAVVRGGGSGLVRETPVLVRRGLADEPPATRNEIVCNRLIEPARGTSPSQKWRSRTRWNGMARSRCGTDEQLRRYLGDEVAGPWLHALREHVAHCEACQARLEWLTADSDLRAPDRPTVAGGGSSRSGGANSLDGTAPGVRPCGRGRRRGPQQHQWRWHHGGGHAAEPDTGSRPTGFPRPGAG